MMRRSLIAVVILMVSSPIYPYFYSEQPVDPDSYYPIVQNGAWGYIDRRGKIVIKPQFETANYFSGGMALVRQGGKYGFINRDGRVVIEPRFALGSYFENGIAVVAVPGPEKYTYRFGTINTKGEYVVRPEKMNIYREGRALFVQDSLNGRLALMLENGRVVTDHAFEEMEIGNTHITEEQNNMDFPEGAPVIKRDIRFAEGLVQYMEKGKYGYMDGDGTVVIPARFDFGFFFKNGEAPVKYRGKWGIINKKGEFVIGAKYGRIGRMGFEEGLCGVRIGGKWGFIDRNEKIVIKPQFWLVGHFSDGAASYAVNTNRSGHPVKYGYIDRSGKPFIQARLVLTMPFRNGLAVALRTASEGRHPYIIDKRCREILWDKYGAEMERMDDDYMILAREGQGGLYLDLKTMATLFVIDYRYYFISLPVNGIIYICFEKSKERAEYGYLDLEGNVIYRYTETGADNIRNGEF